jgi:hypothetical protein
MLEQFVVVGDRKAAQRPAELWRFLPKAFKGYHNLASPADIERHADSEVPIDKLLQS